jgi:hypothetical protein
LDAKQDSEYGVVVGDLAEGGVVDADHHGFSQQVFKHSGYEH